MECCQARSSGVAELECLDAAQCHFTKTVRRCNANRIEIAFNEFNARRAVRVGSLDDRVARCNVRHAAIQRQLRAGQPEQVFRCVGIGGEKRR